MDGCWQQWQLCLKIRFCWIKSFHPISVGIKGRLSILCTSLFLLQLHTFNINTYVRTLYLHSLFKEVIHMHTYFIMDLVSTAMNLKCHDSCEVSCTFKLLRMTIHSCTGLGIMQTLYTTKLYIVASYCTHPIWKG